jgi:hypothetical protein
MRYLLGMITAILIFVVLIWGASLIYDTVTNPVNTLTISASNNRALVQLDFQNAVLRLFCPCNQYLYTGDDGYTWMKLPDSISKVRFWVIQPNNNIFTLAFYQWHNQTTLRDDGCVKLDYGKADKQSETGLESPSARWFPLEFCHTDESVYILK